jgi:hypothetical protein
MQSHLYGIWFQTHDAADLFQGLFAFIEEGNDLTVVGAQETDRCVELVRTTV